MEIGNQQSTAVIAGLYMGEGHFILRRQSHKHGNTHFYTDVGFSNLDPDLVDFVCGWLEWHQIAHFIAKNNSTCYQVRVSRHSHIKKLVGLIEPYMLGKKLTEARLVRKFVEKRMARNVNALPNAERKYDAIDHAMADEKDLLREHSETKRFPRCWNEHRHMSIPSREDMVHTLEKSSDQVILRA